MTDLATLKCVPCAGGVEPLKGEALTSLHSHLDGWDLVDEHHLTKVFKFEDYIAAVVFTNRVAEMSELENHHPTIVLEWGKVTCTIWTHKIDGLVESDFIWAAKADAVASAERKGSM